MGGGTLRRSKGIAQRGACLFLVGVVGCSNTPAEPLTQSIQTITVSDGGTPGTAANAPNPTNSPIGDNEPELSLDTMNLSSLADGSGVLALVRVLERLQDVTDTEPSRNGVRAAIRSRLCRWRVELLRVEGNEQPLAQTLEVYWSASTEWIDDNDLVVYSSVRGPIPTDLRGGYGERRLSIGETRLVLLSSVVTPRGTPLVGSWHPVADLPALFGNLPQQRSTALDDVFSQFVLHRRFYNQQRAVRRRTFETFGPGRASFHSQGRF